ncbi:putative splicing factor 3B subunit 3 isoform X2 [Apostichopus japonicus]|uniref:Putative splicing factor 3B subunit 3 isoform X2 n=1 Tax=Stichopus japonicus TaxID=307972 RepID=A0A2G8JJD7_STIJA|nr:putative splicing factor 3B subunit 3 isoform X2 [Apostichopus japonicus]
MFLYSLTLQRASAITNPSMATLTVPSNSRLSWLVAKILELIKLDPNTGKIYTLLSHEVFGVIRAIMAFRLTGGNKGMHQISDPAGLSGRIVSNVPVPAGYFVKIWPELFLKKVLVHQETFGKSGCRRIVPGQFLAVDPKGRAFMVGAIEKQKLVYILNRDAQARLTISSPLEAHKSSTFSFHIVGVDVGFENPMFACLEFDYEEADSDPTGEGAQNTSQLLTYYELDLGLNHVVRKYSEPLEEHGNFLIAGVTSSLQLKFLSQGAVYLILGFFFLVKPCSSCGSDGPSGVLVCSENYITYKNLGDQPDIRMPIPRRRNDLDDPERGMIFVCSTTHKTKSMFFFLAQTEQGDLFKITLETDEDMVTEVRMKYFDTVPVATTMNVLKTGFLFIAAEFGNHYLYQIAHLGDDDDEQNSAAPPISRKEKHSSLLPGLSEIWWKLSTGKFVTHPQLYPVVACGRGPKSSMRVLRHGLEVSEMAVSELPGNPNAVWTVKRKAEGMISVNVAHKVNLMGYLFVRLEVNL